jgi:hypothetical protein
MNDIEDYKRHKANKKTGNGKPKGILDIIESDFPDRYSKIVDDYNKNKRIFTEEEWIDVLSKSRKSHEKHLKQKKSND